MTPVPRRTWSWERLIVSLAFAGGVTLIVLGVLWSRTGRDAFNYPDAIESVSPAPNDRQVLPETAIIVQLSEGYAGSLAIDGLAIETTDLDTFLQDAGAPDDGEQIQLPPTAIYDQANARITFQPTDDTQITEFDQGVHLVTVTFWKLTEGPDRSDSFTWQFEVL